MLKASTKGLDTPACHQAANIEAYTLQPTTLQWDAQLIQSTRLKLTDRYRKQSRALTNMNKIRILSQNRQKALLIKNQTEKISPWTKRKQSKSHPWSSKNNIISPNFCYQAKLSNKFPLKKKRLITSSNRNKIKTNIKTISQSQSLKLPTTFSVSLQIQKLFWHKKSLSSSTKPTSLETTNKYNQKNLTRRMVKLMKPFGTRTKIFTCHKINTHPHGLNSLKLSEAKLSLRKTMRNCSQTCLNTPRTHLPNTAFTEKKYPELNRWLNDLIYVV